MIYFTDRKSIMNEWDKWRVYIANGGKGSWPRDAFESLLDHFDEVIEKNKQLLLTTLMDVVNQACGDGEYVRHDFLSSYEEAFSVLEDFGVLKDCGKSRYKLLWEAKAATED